MHGADADAAVAGDADVGAAPDADAKADVAIFRLYSSLLSAAPALYIASASLSFCISCFLRAACAFRSCWRP